MAHRMAQRLASASRDDRPDQRWRATDACRALQAAMGVPFDAFARRRVQRAMLDALRDLDWALLSLCGPHAPRARWRGRRSFAGRGRSASRPRTKSQVRCRCRRPSTTRRWTRLTWTSATASSMRRAKTLSRPRTVHRRRRTARRAARMQGTARAARQGDHWNCPSESGDSFSHYEEEMPPWPERGHRCRASSPRSLALSRLRTSLKARLQRPQAYA